jgi:hypothetical protein
MLVLFLFLSAGEPESKKRGIGRQTFAPSFMRRTKRRDSACVLVLD